ncbi:hypothetical protein CRG98_029948 [Punica granatum]|uniref:Uncharacterized protein n=1 Tax=Punica granatum TaxID=22663 RepID=A0A2I0J105_PUNGR|nr:hypothetical protein CRG98_029948 [Punica granatum]
MAFTWPGTTTAAGCWTATESEKVAVITDVLARPFANGRDRSRMVATGRGCKARDWTWLSRTGARRREREKISTEAINKQLSRSNPKADRSSFQFRLGPSVLSLTSLKRSFHSVTIPFEIGDLDWSVQFERSLISVDTCSCGRTRDRTLGRLV